MVLIVPSRWCNTDSPTWGWLGSVGWWNGKRNLVFCTLHQRIRFYNLDVCRLLCQIHVIMTSQIDNFRRLYLSCGLEVNMQLGRWLLAWPVGMATNPISFLSTYFLCASIISVFSGGTPWRPWRGPFQGKRWGSTRFSMLKKILKNFVALKYSWYIHIWGTKSKVTKSMILNKNRDFITYPRSNFLAILECSFSLIYQVTQRYGHFEALHKFVWQFLRLWGSIILHFKEIWPKKRNFEEISKLFQESLLHLLWWIVHKRCIKM